MNNKDKYITGRNAYDLLTGIHYRTGDQCAIPLLTGQAVETLPCLRDDWTGMTCHECLLRWLYEEVDE